HRRFARDWSPDVCSSDLDELLLEWHSAVPEGTYTSIHIPTWRAHDVVGLADRLYPYHEIRVEDEHTVILPAGGVRYVPVPRSLQVGRASRRERRPPAAVR